MESKERVDQPLPRQKLASLRGSSTEASGNEKEDEWENETGCSRVSSTRSSDSDARSDSDSNSDEDDSLESSSGSEQEDAKDYKRGGYHPLKAREFLHNRYFIIRKLGWGHFSTVWMAFDQIEQDFKALKVVRSASTYTETARDEIDLLMHAAKAEPDNPFRHRIVNLHESFELDGPFGHHVVLVMEITGPSLFTVCRRAGTSGLKLLTVRNITRRVLEGLAYMHDKAQMIHTDLKPENISLDISFAAKLLMAKEALKFSNEGVVMPKSMVCSYYWDKLEQENAKTGAVPGIKVVGDGTKETSCYGISKLLEDGKSDGVCPTSHPDALDPAKDICDPLIKIVDMGNACWTFKKFTNDIQTREYRAFEVLMGADYFANVDVWSVGCIAFELATGDYLFNPRHGEDFATDEDHVAQMIERLGNPSRRVATRGKYCHKFFNRRGHFKCFEQKELEPQNITALLTEEYKWKAPEARIFAQFIEACLTYDTGQRPSATTLINHPFFKAELSLEYIMEDAVTAKDDKNDKQDLQAGDTGKTTMKTPQRQSTADPEVMRGIKGANIKDALDDTSSTSSLCNPSQDLSQLQLNPSFPLSTAKVQSELVETDSDLDARCGLSSNGHLQYLKQTHKPNASPRDANRVA